MYLNHKEADTQSVENLLSSLAKQLLCLNRPIPPWIEAYHHACTEEDVTRTPEEIRSRFIQSIKECEGQVFLVIDGWDEARPHVRDGLFNLIESLASYLHVFVLSRPGDVPETLTWTELELNARYEDMEVVVESMIETSNHIKNILKKDKGLRAEVVAKVISHAGGL
jgi:hypothetical protein